MCVGVIEGIVGYDRVYVCMTGKMNRCGRGDVNNDG